MAQVIAYATWVAVAVYTSWVVDSWAVPRLPWALVRS